MTIEYAIIDAESREVIADGFVNHDDAEDALPDLACETPYAQYNLIIMEVTS